jgi:hypothetical protein
MNNIVAKFDPNAWVSIGSAAKLANVTRHWMRLLAKSGAVRSVVIDGQWFVFTADASAYVRGVRVGRPSARKTVSNGQARPAQRADDLQDRQGQPRQKAAQPQRAKAAKR